MKLKKWIQNILVVINVISMAFLGSLVDFELSFHGIGCLFLLTLAFIGSSYVLYEYGNFK